MDIETLIIKADTARTEGDRDMLAHTIAQILETIPQADLKAILLEWAYASETTIKQGIMP